MSFESLITKWQTLNSSVEALAALGAELRMRLEELSGDSSVRSLLQDVVRRIDPELLDGIDANEERAVLALIQTSFRQAIDLIENPARAPGWNYQDPVILESILMAGALDKGCEGRVLLHAVLDTRGHGVGGKGEDLANPGPGGASRGRGRGWRRRSIPRRRLLAPSARP